MQNVLTRAGGPWLGTALLVAGSALAGAAIVLLLGWALAPGTPNQTITTYQDWKLTCPSIVGGAPTCNMTQDIVQAQTGRVVVRLAYGQAAAAGNFVVVVPLDVLLPAGLGLGVGENGAAPVQVPYQTCDQQGCMAFVPMTPELTAALASNEGGRIIFAGLDEKALTVNFSLKGYNDALDALNAENGRRTSWWGFLVHG